MKGLNSPIKRQRVAAWIKKHIYAIYMTRTHFRCKDTHRLKVKGWKEIFHANGNQKKAGVEILTLDKIDSKDKDFYLVSDREGHCIMIKGSIQQEGVIFINIIQPT